MKKVPQLTFHIYPEQGKHQVTLINKFGQKERIDRRKAWILKLRIGKPVRKFMKVCSLHFAEEDILRFSIVFLDGSQVTAIHHSVILNGLFTKTYISRINNN
ncbi:hypothetical protein NQ318_008731 [Aromia moschata]|uniref:THAP-type domain-containing protein n=1 Tax=Aromia moschata TaxID=1265417 RepID=A0AAV8XCI1_9CUCU|nr:hypothetical protein NQ318_008731 [Aromia moschata]